VLSQCPGSKILLGKKSRRRDKSLAAAAKDNVVLSISADKKTGARRRRVSRPRKIVLKTDCAVAPAAGYQTKRRSLAPLPATILSTEGASPWLPAIVPEPRAAALCTEKTEEIEYDITATDIEMDTANCSRH
jgi:hypothetical protein